MKTTDLFYQNKVEPNKSCLLALRTVLLQHNTQMSETAKYGMPCFCYNDKALCYLWTDKHTQEPYILVVDGNLLDHPQLETGTRKRMKIFRIDPNEDLPIDTIAEVLDMAINIRKK